MPVRPPPRTSILASSVLSPVPGESLGGSLQVLHAWAREPSAGTEPSVARHDDVDQQAGVVGGALHVDDGTGPDRDAGADHHVLAAGVVGALVASGQARVRAG